MIDVLRAFALFGIIITHSGGGFLAGRPPRPGFMAFTPFDQLVSQLDRMLVFGKFFTIFSFLFGLSFAIQMRSAEAKGVGFAGRFTWRIVVLALIALVHGAFFSGDILIIYALLAFVLIPFRNVGTRWLVITGLVLALNVPGLLLGASQLNAPATVAEQQAASPQGQAQARAQPPRMEAIRRAFEIKQNGSVAELVQLNLGPTLASKWQFQVVTGRLWMTFGLFLLGVAAGRLSIFSDSDKNRQFFRRLLWGAGALAAVTTAAMLRPASMPLRSVADLMVSYSFTVQQVSLSAFYLALVTLLYWRSPKGWLAKLAPAGKMGLTVYLTQTVFGLLLFYHLGGIGFGALGHMGVAAAVGCGIAFYLVQILLARWWMKHFSMGPVEWLWRSITYLKWQQNARPAAQPA